MLYKSNTVFSWSDKRSLNLYRLSKTSSDGIFDMNGRTSSHLVSNSWTLSSQRDQELYHEHQSHKSSHRSWRRSVFIVKKNRFSFWVFCSSRLTFFFTLEFWMILFKAEAIFASNISKIRRILAPNSSIESTIATSLIHNIASKRKSEQGVTWFFESYLPIQKWGWSREFIKLKFRCLLSLLSNRGTLRNTAELQEHAVSGLLANVGIGIVFPIRSSSIATSLTCGTWCRKLMNSSIGCLWWLKCRTWICKKTFFCDPDRFHVSSGKRLSQTSIARGLGILAGWLGTCEQVPLQFDSTSWNSPDFSKNSSVLRFPATAKWALYCLMIFLKSSHWGFINS